MNSNSKTYGADGRKPINALYDSFSKLTDAGWLKEEIIISRAEHNGKKMAYPILSFRTRKKGNALYLLSGIHGEEPAGPNAIAEGIDYIIKLGEETPIVLLPLCNPLGYARNWRYLNMQKWAKGLEGKSVGDSEHFLLSREGLKKPVRKNPISAESAAITNHVLKLSRDYKPVLTIDMHEDKLLEEGGYVYVNSEERYNSKIAKKIIDILKEKVPIKYGGLTRFGESIVNGIIAKEKDGSIDELLSSKKIIVGGKIISGPSSKTSIVVETPANPRKFPIEKRVEAHLEIIKNLGMLIKLGQ